MDNTKERRDFAAWHVNMFVLAGLWFLAICECPTHARGDDVLVFVGDYGFIADYFTQPDKKI